MSKDEGPTEGSAATPIKLDDDSTPTDEKPKDAENDTAEKEKEKESTSEDEKKDDEKGDGEDAEMKDEEMDEKKKEELKKKYANWPLRNIKEPHENDVMYGRGGGTNHHPGNKKYRKMVEDRKLEYVNSKRLDKPLVALEIIRSWRSQLPPGRFLKLDEKTGLWNDVGDKKAREKTSQALREKAPLIRKQQEEEQDGEKGEGDDDEKSETKTTRFAEGTKEESNQVKKAVLARDHSLGREYIPAGEAVSLEGFSWQDPFQAKKRGSFTREGSGSGVPPPPVPPAHTGTAYPPAGRNSSHGSLGMAPPHHTSIGGPPPPPDFYGRETSHDRQRQFSTGRYESWGSPYPYPPPPAPGMNGSMHQRSGSWTSAPPMPPPNGPRHQRSGSWGSGREHSLAFNPLAGTNLSRPADRRAFDSASRSGSGFWGDIPPPPTPPPGPYTTGRYSSGGSLGPYRQPVSPCNSLSPPNSSSPKPQYSVDMSIARSWSGGEVRRNWSDEEGDPRRQSYEPYEGLPMPGPNSRTTSPHRQPGLAPRPHMVKRDTSNQCETYETKPSVKRAALNRDNSLASNRLKAEYMPEYYNKFNSEQEVKSLSVNLEQSSLNSNSAMKERPKPKPLGEEGRITTADAIAMDLMAKPETLLKEDRISTIDALDLDLDDDPIFNGGRMLREQSRERSIDMKSEMPKPSGLTQDNRLTTQDFMDLVNAPINDGRQSPTQVFVSEDRSLSLNQERIADKWLTQV